MNLDIVHQGPFSFIKKPLKVGSDDTDHKMD